MTILEQKKLKKSGTLETAIGIDMLQMNHSAEVLNNIYSNPKRFLDYGEAFVIPFISWAWYKRISTVFPKFQAGALIKTGYSGVNGNYQATYLIEQTNSINRQLNLNVQVRTPIIFHIGPTISYDFEYGRKNKELSISMNYQFGILGSAYRVNYDYVFNGVPVSSGSLKSRVNYLQVLLSYYL